MTTANVGATSQSELQCTHHTVTIRNKSLEDKFPGGLAAFSHRYKVNSNHHITVYCGSSSAIRGTLRKLEAIGLKHVKDFAALDTVECEMWRMIHSDQVERPFWFETGSDWLRYKHWKGKVLVWYDG